MSEKETTETEQPKPNTAKKVDLVTFVTFMTEFAKEGIDPITIPEGAEASNGGVVVEINDDFNTLFKSAFPNAVLDDCLQEMLEVMIGNYIDKMDDVKPASDEDEINEDEIPIA